MKVKLLINLWKKAEYGITFSLLLLLGTGINMPPILDSIVKQGSYFVITLWVIEHRKRFLYVCTRDLTLLLLIGYAVVSLHWSAAPDATLMNLKAVIRTTMLGAYLAMRYTFKEQMQLLAPTFTICGVLSLVAIVAFKADYGIFVFKNFLGGMMSLGATLALLTAVSNQNQRWRSLVSFCFFTGLVVISRSGTTVTAFIESLVMVPLYIIVRQYYKLRVILLITAIVLGTAIVIFVTSNAESLLTNGLGKDASLTGRGPLWEVLIDQVLRTRPWFGYGFGAFWYTDDSILAISRTPDGWPPVPPAGQYLTTMHSHNGYIEIFEQLGFVGLALCALNFFWVFPRVLFLAFSTRSIEFFWMVQILIMMIVSNYTEASTILTPNTTWMLYVSIALSSAIQQQRINRGNYLSKTLSLG